MDAYLKAKWVAALRSGDYKQGKNQLCDGAAYCCLGVLCEVAGIVYDATQKYILDYGTLLTGSEQRLLATMNDNGCPFTEIADYIEEAL